MALSWKEKRIEKAGRKDILGRERELQQEEIRMLEELHSMMRAVEAYIVHEKEVLKQEKKDNRKNAIKHREGNIKHAHVIFGLLSHLYKLTRKSAKLRQTLTHDFGKIKKMLRRERKAGKKEIREMKKDTEEEKKVEEKERKKEEKKEGEAAEFEEKAKEEIKKEILKNI